VTDAAAAASLDSSSVHAHEALVSLAAMDLKDAIAVAAAEDMAVADAETKLRVYWAVHSAVYEALCEVVVQTATPAVLKGHYGPLSCSTVATAADCAAAVATADFRLAFLIATDVATEVAKCGAEAIESVTPAAETEEGYQSQDHGSVEKQNSKEEHASQGDDASEEEQSTMEEHEGNGRAKRPRLAAVQAPTS